MNAHAACAPISPPTPSCTPGQTQAFRSDVHRGLSAPQKLIRARWLYDTTGSQIFAEITALEEYYPTRTETALLERHGRKIARLVGPGRALVEFGSGSSTKSRLLLQEVAAAAYVPIDISGEHMRRSCDQLSSIFPKFPILPVEADFTGPVSLPVTLAPLYKLGFFPGSTIGNLVPQEAVDLLRSMRETLGEGARLLIGMDRVKETSRLIAAYDDRQGVTARFNLNLIERINREIGADMPREAFRHLVRWNAEWRRIEMHLEALEDVEFTVGGCGFSMRRGETIHTENSHKYSPGSARMLLQAGGWEPTHIWTDPRENFMLILASSIDNDHAP